MEGERSREVAVLPLVEIDIGLLAHEIAVSSADTFYLREGVHDFLLAVHVGVQQTQDELEVRLFALDHRCSE